VKRQQEAAELKRRQDLAAQEQLAREKQLAEEACVLRIFWPRFSGNYGREAGGLG